MAVIRQNNLLGQQRVDVPHLRAFESAVAADLDLLAGQILAGGSAHIVSGFAMIPLSVGIAATSLQLAVASSVIMHPTASESGTIFSVPGNRAVETLNAANPRLSGGFTANTINYIGIDLRRQADDNTSDLVQFLDADTNLEKPKTVPLARTLDYVIVISTQDFTTTPGIAPVAKVTTDSSNNISFIQDARNLYLRLGSGGAVPDPVHAYTWPGGRTEVADGSGFGTADKALTSLKDWIDATMTRLWELGGGEHWYSPTADRNVRMIRGGTAFTNGEWFEWDGTNLHWKGLTFLFDNSTATYNDVNPQTSNSTGLTNLADGECIYVDVDRTVNRTGGTAVQPVKAALSVLGTPAVPGSRYIVAWRKGTVVYTRDSSFPVGATFGVATPTALGLVRLAHASYAPSTPYVAVTNAGGQVEALGLVRGSLGSGAMFIGDDGLNTILSLNGVIASLNASSATGVLIQNEYTQKQSIIDVSQPSLALVSFTSLYAVDESTLADQAILDTDGRFAAKRIQTNRLAVALDIGARYDGVSSPWSSAQYSPGWVGTVAVSDTGIGTDGFARSGFGGNLLVKIHTGGGYGVGTFDLYVRTDFANTGLNDGLGALWSQVATDLSIASGSPISVDGFTVTFSNSVFVAGEIAVFEFNRYQPLFSATKPASLAHTTSFNRFVVDHLGYASGRIDKWNWAWTKSFSGNLGSIAPVYAHLGIVYSNTGGGTPWTGVVAVPTSTYQSSGITLTPNAEGVFDSMHVDNYQFFPDTKTAFAIEFEMDHTTAADTHAKFYIGVTNAADGNFTTANKSKACFVKDTSLGSNAWYYQSASDTAVTTVSTGVTPSGTAADRFRIEYEGSANEVGTATTRFFVNGKCVGVETTNTPVSALKFSLGGHCDSAAPCAIRVSPIDMYWNRRQSCGL